MYKIEELNNWLDSFIKDNLKDGLISKGGIIYSTGEKRSFYLYNTLLNKFELKLNNNNFSYYNKVYLKQQFTLEIYNMNKDYVKNGY